MQGINIEIKARTSDLQRIRQILHEHGAEFRGIDNQIDTYFRVSMGRLKLREGNIENNLIHYVRKDQAGPKKSEVFIHPVAGETGDLKNALSRSCGILIEVKKSREIYYLGNTKFHLDAVPGLGNFVEIESFGMHGDERKLEEICKQFLALLGIEEGDLIRESYSDLLLKTV